jgi:hypothetical protein
LDPSLTIAAHLKLFPAAAPAAPAYACNITRSSIEIKHLSI